MTHDDTLRIVAEARSRDPRPGNLRIADVAEVRR